MFSSTDSANARFVRVFLSAPDRSEELQIPNSIAESAAKASILPDDSLLQNLARGIVRREERYMRPVDTVRIEVWRTQFDAVTLEPRNEKLRDYVFQVAKADR